MADTNAMPASVQVVDVVFILIWNSLLQNDVNRIRNITALFRCVFRSTDACGVWKNWV